MLDIRLGMSDMRNHSLIEVNQSSSINKIGYEGNESQHTLVKMLYPIEFVIENEEEKPRKTIFDNL